MGRRRFLRRDNWMAEFRYCLFCWAAIFLCAFFCCAGTQMIMKDAGAIQMEAFDMENESFLQLDLDEKLDAQLTGLSDVSGVSCEKLLAAVMLKNRFHPGERIAEAEVLADVLGYERLDEEAFLKISSYYKRMLECIEYLPLAKIYTDQKKSEICVYSPSSDIQMEIKDGYRLQFPVEQKWQEIVPVICVKTGIIEDLNDSENTLCLELEEGVRVTYENLKQDLKIWEKGERVESGEILGSVTGTGLFLQFRLRSEDGSWIAFNGRPCLFHGSKKIRSVTQMLQCIHGSIIQCLG